MVQPLAAILVSLVLAYILAEAGRRLGLPRVVGQIAAGLVLSISPLHQLLFAEQNKDFLALFANLGIILLFYYVGLETNFNAFTRNVKRSVLISLFNTTLPIAASLYVMHVLLHADMITSMIVGIALAVSAQSVSVDILEELKMLKSRIGAKIVSAGAVDDIIELFIVTVLLVLLHSSIGNTTLPALVADMALFIALIAIARLWFVPFTLKFFDREKSSTARFTASMIIVLLIASLSDFLHVGTLLGAMVAGMLIRRTIYRDVTIPNWEEHDIAKSTHIIAFGFLIPLFFVSVGLNTDLSLVLPHLGLITLFVLIATIGTVGGTALAVLVSRGSLREGLLLGWGLNPKGDIELAIATLALNTGLISSGIFTALVIAALLTTIISPLAFKHLLLRYTPAKGTKT